MAISERELWACAHHYVHKHRDDAPLVAAMRCDALLARGDLDGVRTYHAILARIAQLLATSPSGPLH